MLKPLLNQVPSLRLPQLGIFLKQFTARGLDFNQEKKCLASIFLSLPAEAFLSLSPCLPPLTPQALSCMES